MLLYTYILCTPDNQKVKESYNIEIYYYQWNYKSSFIIMSINYTFEVWIKMSVLNTKYENRFFFIYYTTNW